MKLKWMLSKQEGFFYLSVVRGKPVKRASPGNIPESSRMPRGPGSSILSFGVYRENRDQGGLSWTVLVQNNPITLRALKMFGNFQEKQRWTWGSAPEVRTYGKFWGRGYGINPCVHRQKAAKTIAIQGRLEFMQAEDRPDSRQWYIQQKDSK